MSFSLDLLRGYDVDVLSLSQDGAAIAIRLTSRTVRDLVADLVDRSPGTSVAAAGTDRYRVVNWAFTGTLHVLPGPPAYAILDVARPTPSGFGPAPRSTALEVALLSFRNTGSPLLAILAGGVTSLAMAWLDVELAHGRRLLEQGRDGGSAGR